MDTRTYIGAQTVTDHYLVVARVKNAELVRKYKMKKINKKWDVITSKR